MKLEKFFSQQIENKKLSHAYLVNGDFDTEQQDFLRKLFEVSLPDLLEEKEPLKIAETRKIIHWLSLKPHSSKRKLVIIYGIELMTLEAANSLLKVLEEPPGESVLILQTKKLDRVLPTIASRCILVKNIHSSVPPGSDYLSPEEISQKSIKDRFGYAAKIADSSEIRQILNEWEVYFRKNLLKGQDQRPILKELERTKDLLLTNTSVKLLLENLLLDF